MSVEDSFGEKGYAGKLGSQMARSVTHGGTSVKFGAWLLARELARHGLLKHGSDAFEAYRAGLEGQASDEFWRTIWEQKAEGK